MRIGIDIDDTIAKTNEELILKARQFDKEYVKGKGFKDPEAYSFMEMFYWNVFDVDNFFKYVKKTNYYQDIEPIENAAKVIRKLHDDGNEIVFITRRSNNFKTKTTTKKWLKNNGFIYDKIIFECRKKGDMCQTENIDLFIDNDAKNVYEALENGIDAILKADKYNQDIDDLRRLDDWLDIYKYIKGVK